MNIEQICELMLLADRFSVDNLKEICETILITSIDKESVVYLLGIGDRFNALALKTSCLSYLTQNIAITKSEIFDELPSMLKVSKTSSYFQYIHVIFQIIVLRLKFKS